MPAARRHLAQQDTSSVAQLASAIICTFLARPDTEAKSINDLKSVIDVTFKGLLQHELQVYRQTGAVLTGYEGPTIDMGEPAPNPVEEPPVEAPAVQSATATQAAPAPAEPEAAAPIKPKRKPAPAPVSAPVMAPRIETPPATPAPAETPAAPTITAAGKIALPDLTSIAVKIPKRLPPVPVENWDAEAWLAKFDNPTPIMIREANADNPNNDRGWVGVYDDHIVDLLTGHEVRILTRHLKKTFENDNRFNSHEAYRTSLNLPEDYPKAAPYLANIRTHEGRQYGTEIGHRRPREIQDKVDAILKQTGLDLTLQVKPQGRPGVFADFIVCLECGEAFHNLKPHLKNAHQTSFDRYRRAWHMSGRATAIADAGYTIDETRKSVLEALRSLGIDPDQQVQPRHWPGVLPDRILCLHDMALVTDLERHLEETGQQPFAHYLASHELPADYPARITPRNGGDKSPATPDAGKAEKSDASSQTSPAPRAKRRTARPISTALADDVSSPALQSAAPAPSLKAPLLPPTETPDPTEATHEESDTLIDITEERLKRQAEEFQRRKRGEGQVSASNQSLFPEPNQQPQTLARRTIQTMESPRKGAPPVVVERKAGKLRLKS